MTKVKMLKTVRGSEDGIHVKMYQKGKEYEIGDELLKCFIDDGVVDLASEKPKPQENKAIEKAPENKSRKVRKSKR